MTGAVQAERLIRQWSVHLRLLQAVDDANMRVANEAAVAEGREPVLFYRSMHLPEKGMFCSLPADLRLGTPLPVRPFETCVPARVPVCVVGGCGGWVSEGVDITSPPAAEEHGGCCVCWKGSGGCVHVFVDNGAGSSKLAAQTTCVADENTFPMACDSCVSIGTFEDVKA